MSLESRKERIFYLGVVPILAAIVGALATAIFQITATPASSFPTAIEVMRDHSLSSTDKIKLLEMMSQEADRPWSVIRTLVTCLTILVGMCAPAIAQRIRDR